MRPARDGEGRHWRVEPAKCQKPDEKAADMGIPGDRRIGDAERHRDGAKQKIGEEPEEPACTLAGWQGFAADWSSDQRAFKNVPWGRPAMVRSPRRPKRTGRACRRIAVIDLLQIRRSYCGGA
jgi:hypothetical protein